MDEKKKYLPKNNGKLIPREINESMGKLPPQALDMEEAVLGGLMLEKDALSIVIGFLLPDHFYKESHKEIYTAILGLHAEGSPVDMRTVRAHLSKSGKIDIVGGAYYIAELTSKISGSANIEYHARIIVEMAIKRYVIQTASKLHHLAYEDSSDPFELLDESIGSLTKLHDTTHLENAESKIKDLWKERLLSAEPPEEVPIITISGEPIATLGNHSLITGKKKARKTLFIVWLIHQYFLQNKKATADDILLFDTEQGKSHVWKVRKKIFKLTGHELPIFFLRGLSPSDRRDFIKNTVKYWKKPTKIVVIDGIRDLLSNINDVDESTDVIVWLEQLIITHNVHVMNILHQNKNDKNPRGHIGTELSNKAEITIELEKDEQDGCTVVKSESSREKDFEPFSFTHGKDDLPEIVGLPIHGIILPDKTKRDILIAAFIDGPMNYTDLINEIKANFAVGKSKAETLIREFRREGYIVKSGKDRDPKALWKIMIDENSPYLVAEEPVKPPELFDEKEEISEDLPF